MLQYLQACLPSNFTRLQCRSGSTEASSIIVQRCADTETLCRCTPSPQPLLPYKLACGQQWDMSQKWTTNMRSKYSLSRQDSSLGAGCNSHHPWWVMQLPPR